MTLSSRRTLIKTGLMAGVAALPAARGAAAGFARQLPTAPSKGVLARASLWPPRSVFVGQVGSTFRVRAGFLKALRLTLDEVADLPQTAVAGFEETFTVVFSGPTSLRLRQGSYVLDHAAIGQLELFIVPIGRPGGRLQKYEAIFNRQLS